MINIKYILFSLILSFNFLFSSNAQVGYKGRKLDIKYAPNITMIKTDRGDETIGIGLKHDAFLGYSIAKTVAVSVGYSSLKGSSHPGRLSYYEEDIFGLDWKSGYIEDGDIEYKSTDFLIGFRFNPIDFISPVSKSYFEIGLAFSSIKATKDNNFDFTTQQGGGAIETHSISSDLINFNTKSIYLKYINNIYLFKDQGISLNVGLGSYIPLSIKHLSKDENVFSINEGYSEEYRQQTFKDVTLRKLVSVELGLSYILPFKI